MDTDEIWIFLTQNLAQLPGAREVRQRILALEIKRDMPSARRLDAPDHPSAFRNDNRFPPVPCFPFPVPQSPHKITDDALNAALLKCRKEVKDLHRQLFGLLNIPISTEDEIRLQERQEREERHNHFGTLFKGLAKRESRFVPRLIQVDNTPVTEICR